MTRDALTDRKILPTHTCFDDALDFIEYSVRSGTPRERILRMRIVHGICRVPEGHRSAGALFAHAWVEDRGLVWEGGLLDGRKVWRAVSLAEFHASLRPTQYTRYTVQEAAAENARSGHYGPWRPEYVAQLDAEHARPDGPRVFDELEDDDEATG